MTARLVADSTLKFARHQLQQYAWDHGSNPFDLLSGMHGLRSAASGYFISGDPFCQDIVLQAFYNHSQELAESRDKLSPDNQFLVDNLLALSYEDVSEATKRAEDKVPIFYKQMIENSTYRRLMQQMIDVCRGKQTSLPAQFFGGGAFAEAIDDCLGKSGVSERDAPILGMYLDNSTAMTALSYLTMPPAIVPQFITEHKYGHAAMHGVWEAVAQQMSGGLTIEALQAADYFVRDNKDGFAFPSKDRDPVIGLKIKADGMQLGKKAAEFANKRGRNHVELSDIISAVAVMQKVDPHRLAQDYYFKILPGVRAAREEWLDAVAEEDPALAVSLEEKLVPI